MGFEFKFLSDANREEFVNFILKTKSEFLVKTMNVKTFNLLFKYLDIKNELSFIFMKDGMEIGMFLGANRGGTAYISNMFVVNESRNMGYGTIILQKATSLFKEKKCGLIRLEVLKENKEAAGLYLKEGFSVSNEIFQFQNNKNSFYTKLTSGIKIEKGNGFLFQPLSRTFRNNPVPWIRDIRSLIALIDAGYVELDLMKKEDSVAGYVISSRKNGILKIYDLALKESGYDRLDGYLTLLLGNERTVMICSLYKDDIIAAAVMKSGFFPNIIQYEMVKPI